MVELFEGAAIIRALSHFDLCVCNCAGVLAFIQRQRHWKQLSSVRWAEKFSVPSCQKASVGARYKRAMQSIWLIHASTKEEEEPDKIITEFLFVSAIRWQFNSWWTTGVHVVTVQTRNVIWAHRCICFDLNWASGTRPLVISHQAQWAILKRKAGQIRAGKFQLQGADGWRQK